MSVIEYNEIDFLSKCHPLLRKHIEELLLNENIALNHITYNDITPVSIKLEDDDELLPYLYHFAIKIPYAGKKLTWEVVFNPENFHFPPDFFFNDDHFLVDDVDLIKEHVPTLLTWKPENSQCLSQVLQEFLKLYKKNQVDTLQRENIYSNIYANYKLLCLDKKLSSNDFEVLVDSSSVHFLIKINVNCSSLPAYLQQSGDKIENPHEDYVHLKISFIKLDGSRTTTFLHLSPRLEQVLGNNKTLHIPNFTREISVVEYVALVSSNLAKLIKDIKNSYRLKKQYVTYIASVRNKSLIEYDAEKFTKVVFMCEVDDYYCLVCIVHGNRFPNDKPKLTLHSVYCIDSKKPCTKILDGYPYKPEWKIDEMVHKLMAFLLDAIQKFKDHKH